MSKLVESSIVKKKTIITTLNKLGFLNHPKINLYELRTSNLIYLIDGVN